ncbi:trypsin-like peptidase domain-containing protein [Paenibacillus eucommiae]|uniref:Trypsin-like serine protease n=1 Tax=Paenibacillus eucommiae TaxID=1355755 RepID=A0ABS4IVT5_9BACL|nr:trypsin-like peptidase domain-containing protein [Paenibacillus eucommiae]MBP1991707.1 hypothetical protein [Paenibacillus eucommiae]
MKKVISSSIIFLFVFIYFLNVSADNITDQNDVEFRNRFGLSVDTGTLNKANLDSEINKSKEIYGVELTNEEVAILSSRQTLASEVSGLNLENYPTYAGRYIDTKTGVLHIGFTDSNVLIQETILQSFSDKEKIEFFLAEYTEKELQKKADLFSDTLKNSKDPIIKNLKLVSSGLSPKDNKVKVTITKETPTNDILKIKEIIGEDYVIFETGESYERMSRTDNHRPLIAGVKLEKDVFTFNKACTSGFAVKDNSNVVGILTAGHCFSLSEYAWQPEVQTFSTSNRLAKPTRWSGENSNADAAFIPYSNVSGKIYSDDPVKGEVSSTSLTIGQLIAYEGMISDLKYGNILCVSCDIIFGPGDVSYSQIKADVGIQHGDSGGPAFIVPTTSPYNILAAGLAVAGNSSHTIISAINNIKSTLGISNVITSP